MDEFASLESDLSMSIQETTSRSNRRAALKYFIPKYDVRLANKPAHKGYYRVGKMADFDDMVEKHSEFTSKLIEDFPQDESPSFIFGVLGWILISPFIVMFVALLGFMALYLIPLLLLAIPLNYLRKFFSKMLYKGGMFPSKMLTEVDHLYIHPDGTIIVPMGGTLQPFTFEIKEHMEVVTHYHNGIWQSISMVYGRRQYFKLVPPKGHPGLEFKAVSKFLNEFGLYSHTRYTEYQSDGGSGGG